MEQVDINVLSPTCYAMMALLRYDIVETAYA